MKHHILLPTDFSNNAWSAIRYALKLYQNESCTFYLLHAWTFIDSGSRTYITTSYVDELQDESEKELIALKEKAKTESNNAFHSFKTIFSTDDFLNCVKSTVKEYNIDMVIMGTKGSSGVVQILFGSNTVTLMSKMQSCPVLAIPEGFDFVIPKNIAFPTDYNRFYGEELDSLKHLSSLYNSKIRVLHINEENNLSDAQNYNFAILKAYLEEYSTSFHWADREDKKEKVIKNFIKEHHIDVLVMINYQHSFIESIIKEPVIKKIGFQLSTPFLVIPCSK